MAKHSNKTTVLQIALNRLHIYIYMYLMFVKSSSQLFICCSGKICCSALIHKVQLCMQCFPNYKRWLTVFLSFNTDFSAPQVLVGSHGQLCCHLSNHFPWCNPTAVVLRPCPFLSAGTLIFFPLQLISSFPLYNTAHHS